MYVIKSSFYSCMFVLCFETKNTVCAIKNIYFLTVAVSSYTVLLAI